MQKITLCKSTASFQQRESPKCISKNYHQFKSVLHNLIDLGVTPLLKVVYNIEKKLSSPFLSKTRTSHLNISARKQL